ncbi:MAG: hypothetical protein ACTHKT_14395 [Solirubrobacterales bacterium]
MSDSESVHRELANADAWAAENRGLLTACFEEFSATGEWPRIEALEHHFEVAGENIEVGYLAWQMPRPLGFVEMGCIVLLCRALLVVDEARPLLDAWFEAVKYAYRGWLKDPKGRLNSHEIVNLLGGDEQKARLLSKLLFREGWMFGSGQGSEDEYWTREIISAVKIVRDAPDAAGLIEARASQVAAQVPSSVPALEEEEQIAWPCPVPPAEAPVEPNEERPGRLRRGWRYVTGNNYLAAVAAALTMVVLGTLYVLAHQVLDSGDGKSSRSAGGRAPAGGVNGIPHKPPASYPGTVVEYADNRAGSPVFANPEGAAVDGLPGRIPYGTRVLVSCVALNESGMSSVSGFYLIASGRWRNNYVVSDTMTNGGPVGTTTTPNIDPHVPRCDAER